MFWSTQDHHQVIKPKQYRIKPSYPLLYTFMQLHYKEMLHLTYLTVYALSVVYKYG